MVGIGFELVVVVLVWLSYSDKTRGRCVGASSAVCDGAVRGSLRARAVIKEHQLATIIPLE